MKKILVSGLLMGFLLLLTGCELADISGTWTGQGSFTSGDCGTGTTDVTLDILQDGDAVSGEIILWGITFAFSGTISEGVFTFSGDEVDPEPWQSIDIDGTFVPDSTVTGSFILYTDGTCFGTFSLTREG